MTGAYLSITTRERELRVYNRGNNSSSTGVIKTKNEEKKLLKRLGFVWDRHNHSYVLENPTDEAVKEIEKFVPVPINDYTKPAHS